MFARLTLIAALLLSSSAFAQLSPPGLGSANTAGWFAAGVHQDLDADRRRHAMPYVGVGTVSGLGGDYDPLRAPASVVLNHEVYDHSAEHWLYSIALSYPRQRAEESVEQEFRSYGRFAHVAQAGPWKLTDITWDNPFGMPRTSRHASGV